MIHTSLFNWTPASPTPKFYGFGNFLSLVQDGIFWIVMRNSLLYVVGSVPITIGLALFIANFLYRTFRGVGILRAMFVHPMMLPLIGAAAIWLAMYVPGYGVLATLLKHLGVGRINWLGDPFWALPSIILVSVWKYTGYYMLFFMAGFQAIPNELYEAADMDGISAARRFVSISLPLLGPTLLFTLIIAVVNAFQLVDHIWVMTDGGPINSTNVLLFYIYQEAFQYWNYGKGAAVSLILTAILITIAVLNLRLWERKIYYA